MSKFETYEPQPRDSRISVNKFGRYSFPYGEENNNYKHGHCGKVRSRTHNCWRWMKNRLKYSEHYKDVSMQKDWEDFVVFLREVGEAPTDNHTLGRIDNSKGYQRDNVKWETMHEQTRNKSSNIWIEGQILKDWSNSRGFNYKTVWRWVKEGKSLSYMKSRGKELWGSDKV